MQTLFLDTETTGFAKHDRLCQIAFKLGDFVVNQLYNPRTPISPGARGVHGISEAMVRTRPLFKDGPTFSILKELAPHVIFVAHNAPFDLRMLEREGLVFPHVIDTQKIVKHLDPLKKLGSHKLQNLRDHYKMQIEAQAHDALGDVLVLERLFHHQLVEIATRHGIASEEETVNRMLRLCAR